MVYGQSFDQENKRILAGNKVVDIKKTKKIQAGESAALFIIST
jgi:hypothetical protein